MHHEDDRSVISGQTLLLKEVVLVRDIRPPNLDLLPFLARVDLTVKFFLQLSQDGLGLAALGAGRVREAKDVQLAVRFLPLPVVAVCELNVPGLHVGQLFRALVAQSD